MKIVYTFTAITGSGTLCVTKYTRVMFDVMRKVDDNYVKLRNDGVDVSVGVDQTRVSIAQPGEYAVVTEGNHSPCELDGLFQFSEKLMVNLTPVCYKAADGTEPVQQGFVFAEADLISGSNAEVHLYSGTGEPLSTAAYTICPCC